jgi:hypothetical protein
MNLVPQNDNCILPIHSLILMLKYELKVINFPRHVLTSSTYTVGCCERVVVVKRNSTYTHIRVNGNMVAGRSVFVHGYSPTHRFHPRPAAGNISFWSTAQKLWIIIMQLRKTFDLGDRKLKETWLNLMKNPLVKAF